MGKEQLEQILQDYEAISLHRFQDRARQLREASKMASKWAADTISGYDLPEHMEHDVIVIAAGYTTFADGLEEYNRLNQELVSQLKATLDNLSNNNK